MIRVFDQNNSSIRVAVNKLCREPKLYFPLSKAGCHRFINIRIAAAFIFFIIFSSLQATTHSNNLYRNIHFRYLTINDGLSQNFISCIHQDHFGFIWIGTKDGLNMYDGYNFTIYKHDLYNPNSLSDNFIKTIHCDNRGRLWCGTMNAGLNLFDRKTGNFIRFLHDPEDQNSISNNNVQAIVSDQWGNLWIGTNGGGLVQLILPDSIDQITSANTRIIRWNSLEKGFPNKDTRVKTLLIDANDRLWVGTTQGVFTLDLNDQKSGFKIQHFKQEESDKLSKNAHSEIQSARVIIEGSDGAIIAGNSNGLFEFCENTDVFTPFKFADPTYWLTNVFSAVISSQNGVDIIWVGTEDGLNIINYKTREHSQIRNDNNKPGSLQMGNIISLFTDTSNTVWIGSNGYGIAIFSPATLKFGYPEDKDPISLLSSRNLSIRSFFETAGKNNFLWIGSNESLFRINRRTGELKDIFKDKNTAAEPFMITSIQEDMNGYLWLGSSQGLVKYNPQNNAYKIYPANLTINNLVEDRVSSVRIIYDTIWVLTPNSLARFNQGNEKFEHFIYNQHLIDEFREAVYPYMYEDGMGNFWLGTSVGLFHYDRQTQTISNFLEKFDPTNQAIFRDIRTIIPDPFEPEDYLWLATAGGGIYRIDIQKLDFRVFSENEGLPNKMVYGMLYDDNGSFWMSTNRGLSRFNIKDNTFDNFDVSDGLQSNEFNSGAFYKSPTGEMFFGGIKGYNHFFPAQILKKSFMAPVVITRFSLLSSDPQASVENQILNIHKTNKVSLKHHQNNFTAEFASLDFATPGNNVFAYTLHKSEDQWIYLGKTRNVTFTNMKPGTYTLRVRGTNNDGVWSDHQALLNIYISKPWWKKPWAYAIYLTLLLATLIVMRRYELSRIGFKNRLKIANLEADKLKEIDLMKSQFFANISHEFRTPLTLIKGPLEQMIAQRKDQNEQKILLEMHSNTDKLLNLINQLLDLSKLEDGQIGLKVSNSDIIGQLRGLVTSIKTLAEKKNIKLRFIEAASLKDSHIAENFYFDSDVIEKIMLNLLSNALKFTPENGRITITACLRKLKNNNQYFEIVITDSGVGIPMDKLPFIYNRFYQIDSSSKRKHEGFGIGLAYVKELVDLHKGKIAVMSKPGKGTSFRLRFPIGSNHYLPEQMVTSQELTQTLSSIIFPENIGIPDDKTDTLINKFNTGKPLVLVVDDHADVRSFICGGLEKKYQLEEAPDAIEGLEKADELIPDLIISDVMMPGMDGFEFCEKLKSDEKTSHIPVILLTAKASDRDKIHGLETGADDYLTKPFNTQELLVRVTNLIESRKILRKKFGGKAIIKPGEISVSSRDRVFMEKVLRIVELNIHEENFTVEVLAKEVGMSPSQLHRKLKALVDQTTLDFIRSVRMNQAKELLERNAGNIAEIAYMVGFSDPGYFTKTYKSFFGKLPSESKEA